MSARAVIDLDPGSATLARTGAVAVGAAHSRAAGADPSRAEAGMTSIVPGTVAAMCGRYASTRSTADLAALFEALDETGDGWTGPDYNVAPTDPVPIVRHSARVEEPVITLARWGLVPAWAADTSGAARMINARAETVATSRAFGRPFAERRCLVPAQGWYEWRVDNGAKQPYFMTIGDDETLAFGGIWTASEAQGKRILTFSIVTLPAAGQLAFVHHRMPLVLAPSDWVSWLTTPDPGALLRPAEAAYAAKILLRPVSNAVGDVRNDGPQLIREVPVISAQEDSVPTLF
jgi:putative SOS response-associated peptidase YedK